MGDISLDDLKRYLEEIEGFFRKKRVDPQLATDLVQETIVEAGTSIANGKGPHSDPLGWLIGIARHRWCKYLRRQYQGQTTVLDGTIEELVEDRSFDDLSGDLEDCLNRLDEKPRRVFSLRHFECLSREEIAKLLDCSQKSVSRYYGDAITKLHCCMTRKGWNPLDAIVVRIPNSETVYLSDPAPLNVEIMSAHAGTLVLFVKIASTKHWKKHTWNEVQAGQVADFPCALTGEPNSRVIVQLVAQLFEDAERVPVDDDFRDLPESDFSSAPYAVTVFFKP